MLLGLLALQACLILTAASLSALVAARLVSLTGLLALLSRSGSALLPVLLAAAVVSPGPLTAPLVTAGLLAASPALGATLWLPLLAQRRLTLLARATLLTAVLAGALTRPVGIAVRRLLPAAPVAAPLLGLRRPLSRLSALPSLLPLSGLLALVTARRVAALRLGAPLPLSPGLALVPLEAPALVALLSLTVSPLLGLAVLPLLGPTVVVLTAAVLL